MTQLFDFSWPIKQSNVFVGFFHDLVSMLYVQYCFLRQATPIRPFRFFRNLYLYSCVLLFWHPLTHLNIAVINRLYGCVCMQCVVEQQVNNIVPVSFTFCVYFHFVLGIWVGVSFACGAYKVQRYLVGSVARNSVRSALLFAGMFLLCRPMLRIVSPIRKSELWSSDLLSRVSSAQR